MFIMKKSLTKICLKVGVFLSLGCLVVSCSKTDVDPTTPPGPGPEPGENTFVITDVVTPLRYTESKYIGAAEGVTIEVDTPMSDNIKFVCKPGADINSYRVQVYPVGSLYNTLINAMHEAKKEQFSVDETMDLMAGFIQNTEGTSSSILANKATQGDEFASYEYNYMDSQLHVFQIQPNNDYLIVVQACFDTEGKKLADLCICHTKSAKKDLVGMPEINMNVQTSYTGYRVTHVPNDDCKTFYFLSAETSEIQTYIDAYGTDMYRQLLCHYGDAVSRDDQDNLAFERQNMKAEGLYTTTALALDANGTSSNKVARQDFTLPKLPENTEIPECLAYPIDKCGASIAYFNTKLEKNCLYMVFNVYPKATAEGYMNSDAATQYQLKRTLYDKDGWVVTNKNFVYDKVTDQLTGSDYSERERLLDIDQDTEYAIVYFGVNYFGEFSDLKIGESFKTKKLVRDQPSASKSDIQINMTGTSRTSVSMEFVYSEENTALFYFQNYDYDFTNIPDTWRFPDVKDASDAARHDPTKGWLHWLIDIRLDPLQSRWPNVWWAETTGPAIINEPLDIFGYLPTTRYEFCYIGEDWNGVLGPVKFFTATTQTPVGGPNPHVTLSANKVAGNTNQYLIDVNANDHTASVLYLAYSIKDADPAAALALANLQRKDPNLSYDDYIQAWEKYTIQQGLPSNELSTSLDVTMNGDFMAAMALAIGEKDGNPVYSKLATLIFSEGKIVSLEEYLGVPILTSSLFKHAPKARQAPTPIITRPAGLRASELQKATY